MVSKGKSNKGSGDGMGSFEEFMRKMVEKSETPEQKAERLAEEAKAKAKQEAMFEIIRAAGYPVYMNTPECDAWQKDHQGNCKGCASDLGCCKAQMMNAANEMIETLSEMPALSKETISRVKEEITLGIMGSKTVKETLVAVGRASNHAWEDDSE